MNIRHLKDILIIIGMLLTISAAIFIHANMPQLLEKAFGLPQADVTTVADEEVPAEEKSLGRRLSDAQNRYEAHARESEQRIVKLENDLAAEKAQNARTREALDAFFVQLAIETHTVINRLANPDIPEELKLDEDTLPEELLNPETFPELLNPEIIPPTRSIRKPTRIFRTLDDDPEI